MSDLLIESHLGTLISYHPEYRNFAERNRKSPPN